MTNSATAQTDWDQGPAAFTNLDHYKAAVTRASDEVPLPLRSIYWKVFLLFRDNDRSKWLGQLADARSAYDSIRSRYTSPSTSSPDTDPLSDDSLSRQSTKDNDIAIEAEVVQDVLRCMPELDYFRDPTVQKLMTDILFVYAKLNPDFGYRQGMHELLAPILWVVSQDALSDPPTDKNNLLYRLCDQNFVEHDAFTLFNIVMQNAKSFYEPTTHASQNPILARIERIFTTALGQLDNQLAIHLSKLQLLPQIFLLFVPSI